MLQIFYPEMSEDINEKIRRLTKEMKRQKEWQMTTAKKGEKVETSSATKTSIKVKITSTKEKPSTKGKGPIVTCKQAASTEVKIHPTWQKRLINVPVKTFATIVVKNWYNSDLKDEEEDIYNKINGCFRSLQSNNLKSSNY